MQPPRFAPLHKPQQPIQHPLQLQPREHLAIVAPDAYRNRVPPPLAVQAVEPRQQRDGLVGMPGDALSDRDVRAGKERFDERGREPAFANVRDAEGDVRAGCGDGDGEGDGGVRGGRGGVQ